MFFIANKYTPRLNYSLVNNIFFSRISQPTFSFLKKQNPKVDLCAYLLESTQTSIKRKQKEYEYLASLFTPILKPFEIERMIERMIERVIERMIESSLL